MLRRIAIPTNDSELNTHFGHARFFTLVDTSGDMIISETNLEAPPHQPGVLPRWLAENGVTDVIAGGMGERAQQLLEHKGIRVFTGAPALNKDELVRKFLDNSLTYSPHQCHH
jgi:predicted Fe-Mo cluster-binding NifX family protein